MIREYLYIMLQQVQFVDSFCGVSALTYPNTALAYLEKTMPLQALFDQALADSKNLSERPDNMTLLRIYALYKQSTTGDAEGKRPGFTDMVGRAKWDAWDALQGTSKTDAMQQYVDLITELKG